MQILNKNFEELAFKAVLIEKSKIKDFLNDYSSSLLNKQRIPNVIHLYKTYNTFSLKIDQTLIQDPENTVIVLLKNTSIPEYSCCDVTLYLNANFYSHSELIRMLTPCNLEFSAYELVGDIVHLNLTDEQIKYKQLIADIIHFKTSKTVINKTGKIQDVYRFYQYEVLAGPDNLKTVQSENNCKFFIDLGKVYWCSRLQSERSKIIKMVKSGELICDPFCGVGPHVIPALKNGAEAICNDLNPNAIDCLKISLEMNDVKCKIIENTDAGAFLESHKNLKVDHFIFNLPEHSLKYIKYTEKYSGNFFLHVFFFCKLNENVCEYIKKITGYLVKPEWVKEVRNVSPSKSVFKIEVKSNEFFKFQN